MKRRIVRLKARPLFAVLRALGSSGTRMPALEVGVYRVGLDTSNRRLYATCGVRAIGSISISGIFRISAGSAREIESVKLLVENTLDVARGAAILEGLKARCALCGRLLDSKDRLQGIGAGCYKKAECWRLEPKSKK